MGAIVGGLGYICLPAMYDTSRDYSTSGESHFERRKVLKSPWLSRGTVGVFSIFDMECPTLSSLSKRHTQARGGEEATAAGARGALGRSWWLMRHHKAIYHGTNFYATNIAPGMTRAMAVFSVESVVKCKYICEVHISWLRKTARNPRIVRGMRSAKMAAGIECNKSCGSFTLPAGRTLMSGHHALGACYCSGFATRGPRTNRR